MINDTKPTSRDSNPAIDIALPRWINRYRRLLVVIIHFALMIAASYEALSLRFDGDIPPREYALWMNLLPWILLIRGLVFVPFRLYEGLWRYSSVFDLRDIILAVSLGTGIIYGTFRIGFGYTEYPRSVYILEAILLIFLAGGIRLVPRVLRNLRRTQARKRILIFGAGDSGAMVVRDILHTGLYEYQPIGFIDDDETKVGQRIHGIKVLGTRSDLAKVMHDVNPDSVLLAMPRVDAREIRNI